MEVAPCVQVDMPCMVLYAIRLALQAGLSSCQGTVSTQLSFKITKTSLSVQQTKQCRWLEKLECLFAQLKTLEDANALQLAHLATLQLAVNVSMEILWQRLAILTLGCMRSQPSDCSLFSWLLATSSRSTWSPTKSRSLFRAKLQSTPGMSTSWRPSENDSGWTSVIQIYAFSRRVAFIFHKNLKISIIFVGISITFDVIEFVKMQKKWASFMNRHKTLQESQPRQWDKLNCKLFRLSIFSGLFLIKARSENKNLVDVLFYNSLFPLFTSWSISLQATGHQIFRI